MSASAGVAPSVLRLNLGGEGETAECINQQPLWRNLGQVISRNGLPLQTLLESGVPILFCDNTALCFPDATVDEVVTNSVPIDVPTHKGPAVSSSEIKRVLKPGGAWYHDGDLVHRRA